MSLIKFKNLSIEAKVAVTHEEQSKGLMGVAWPPPVMAFPSSPDYRKFWMKNTPSPLDIVFSRDGKIIHIANGIPYSTTMVGPDVQVDLVTEFPSGFVRENKIKVGDTIDLDLSLNDRKKILQKIKIYKNI